MPPGKTTMQLMPIDSEESLEAADLPPGAARAIVRVITGHVDAAVSNLATKDDVERLRLDTTNEFERSRLATADEFERFRLATTNGFEKSRLETETLRVATTNEFERQRLATANEFERFRLATTHEIAACRFSMKSDFDEFRVSLHRLFLKWFGALISSCVALLFLLIQHMQK